MSDETPRAQINMSKMPVSGGLAGAFVALASMAIFLAGVPLIRYLFPPAIAVGCAVAFVLHFKKHKAPGASWILPPTTK